MKQKLMNFIEKPFVKNVVVLTTGTIGAQIITLLFTPIITRLYGPEIYGIMGSFQAVMLIFIPIAALSLPIAIVLPKNDREARGIIALSFYITVIFSVLTLIVILLFKEKIIEVFKLHVISPYLYLIPIVILFAGLSQIYNQWLIREKKFSVSAKTNFADKFFINSGKVLVGFLKPTAGILIFFTVITNGIHVFFIYLITKKNIIKESLNEKISYKTIFLKYKDFPLFRAPEVFINAISGNLPIILLTSFFGATSAGFFSIGRSVLEVPSQLIGKSIGDVFYPRISEGAQNKENITKLILKATFILMIIGAIPYGLIILFGPQLFSFIFGYEWLRAGEYARWMAIWTFFTFINKPSVIALPVLKAQKFQLFYTVFILIVRIIALLIGFLIFTDDLIAIALFGIVGAFLNIGLILTTLVISKKFDNNNI